MRKVLKYLKPYRTAAILTVFLVLLHSLSQLILPSMMADIINEGITRGELSYIWRVGTIMLAISAVGVLVSILASACSSKASTGFGRELRRAVFYKVESLSQSDIDKIGTPVAHHALHQRYSSDSGYGAHGAAQRDQRAADDDRRSDHVVYHE